MLVQVGIDRYSFDGRYCDVLAVLEHLQPDFGSAVNAAANCIRDSSIFKDAQAKMKKTKRVAVPK